MFNKSEIMRRAWVWAKQDLWSARAPKSKLRAFLAAAVKRAWAEVKMLATRVTAPAVAQRLASEIRADLFAFECKDTMRGSDWTCLDIMRAALTAAEAREAVAA